MPRRHFAVAFTLLLSLLTTAASFASATPSSHEGQVVCSQCWFEADRSRVAYGTPGDLDCAARCAETGVPAALALRDAADGSFELLLLGDPPAGQPAWLELTGRFVRVSGEVHDKAGKKRIDVAALEVLEDSPWPAPSTAEPAEPAALSWPDLSGHRLSLDGLRGRVVVLNFWATWCPPCLEEIPELVRVQQEYGVLGVQVIGAGADAPDRADDVLKFARRRHVNFPIVLGAQTGQMQALGLGVELPSTVVLDREGRVVERFRGVFRRARLEAAIEKALRGSDPPEAEGHAAAHGPHAHDDHAGHVHVGGAGATEASLVPS